MLKIQISIYIFLFVASIGTAQDNCLVTIRDASTKEPLPFASIQSQNSEWISSTDGTVSLPLNTELTISFLGYQSRELQLSSCDSSVITLSPSEHILDVAVVSGNRSGERLLDAIAPLDILSKKMIKSRSNPNLQSYINRMPGVQIIDGQFSVRGGAGYAYGAGSRVAVMLDDIPMLQPDAGSINWRELPLELIESVELVKGPSATLYGSSALNGVLHMQTWPRMRSDTAYTSAVIASNWLGQPAVSDSAGWYKIPHGSYWAHVIHKDLKGKFQWQGGVRWEDLTSHIQDSYQHRFRTSFLGRYQWNTRTIGLNAYLNASDNQSYLYWQDGEQGILQGDPNARVANRIWRLQLDPYIHWESGQNAVHQLQGRIFSSNTLSRENRNSSVQQYLAQYQLKQAIGGGRGQLVGGATASAFLSEAELFNNQKFWSYNAAAFIQYQHMIGRFLRVQGGVRVEHNSQQVGDISFQSDTFNASQQRTIPLFSFGANYSISPSTHISFQFGQGYRFPTIAEKFITTNLGAAAISPNPYLEDEEGQGVNLSIKQGVGVGSFRSLLRLDLFWMRYERMIEFGVRDISLGFQAINTGDTDSKGIEVSWTGEYQTDYGKGQFLTSYTYILPTYVDFEENREDIIARSTSENNILKYRVQHQWTLQYVHQWAGWNVSCAMLYNSDMEAIDKLLEAFVIEGLADYRVNAKGAFYRLDASVGYQWPQLGVLLDIENILNETYSLRPGRIEAPRNISFQLTYQW